MYQIPTPRGRFERDPQALRWARDEVREALGRLDAQIWEYRRHGQNERAEGFRAALVLVRQALLGAGSDIAAFDERRPALESARSALR